MISSSLALLIFYGTIGLCIGSFLNVVIIRVPIGKSISFPSSHCVKCNHPLKWYHNIPIFSWIILKGKCSYCKEKISIQYPIVEILTTLIFISVAYKIPNTINIFLIATLFSMLLALSVIDLKYKAVPDNISIPALFLSLFVNDFLISLTDALILAGAFSLLRIIVSWLIKPNGKVSDVKISKTTLKSERVESCIIKKIKRWIFPKPIGGGDVKVKYPFIFKPA